jgi:hypothetical protein
MGHLGWYSDVGVIVQFPAETNFYSSLNCTDLLPKVTGLIFDGYWQLFSGDKVARECN